MANDYATLDAWIAKLRRMGPELATSAANDCAPEVEKVLGANLAAGQAPDGSAWAERQEGGRAYAGAASKLDVTGSGSTIVATVTGPEVWGHRGVRGAPRRQMVPTVMVPILAAAITRVLSKKFRKLFS